MNILHCFFSFNVGGAEAMLVDIINEQIKSTNITLIIVNRNYDNMLLNKIDKRVNILLLNRKRGSKSIIPILKLNYYIWRLNPDAIHLHSSTLDRLLPFRMSNLFLTVHDMGIDQTYFHRYKRLFAISESVKNDIISSNNYPVQVISNGINVQVVNQNKSYHKEFKIIQVANLISKKKGQDILINALSLVIHKYHFDNITVDFIGQGDSLVELKELVKKLDIENNVCFLGLRDRDYIYSHLCDYDLMCHPSRFEGFGLVVAEGMAAKIPVLVATGDGPFEIIEGGKYGYYFERENAEDCASKIVDIYKNYENRSLIVDKAYQHVLEKYSIEQTARRYLEEYK